MDRLGCKKQVNPNPGLPMKTLARTIWFLAMLAGALIISGCASDHARTAARHPRLVKHFTVVESSVGRPLTPTELAIVEDSAAQRLDNEGVLGQPGVYYVRVTLTTGPDDEPDGWVLVKMTNLAAPDFERMVAYNSMGSDDYYPVNYLNNYGYGYGFGSSYDVWDSPYGYYDPGIYYPDYRQRRSGNGNPAPSGDHKPGDRPPWEQDNHRRGPNPGSDGRNDGNNNAPGHEHRPANTGYTPRSGDNGGTRDHGTRDNSPRPANTGGSPDHGSRDYSRTSSRESTGGSNYAARSAPSPAPAPVASTPRDTTDSNSKK